MSNQVTADDELEKKINDITQTMLIALSEWQAGVPTPYNVIKQQGRDDLHKLVKEHELDARIDEHKGMVDQIAGNPMHTIVASYHYGRINALKAEREKL